MSDFDPAAAMRLLLLSYLHPSYRAVSLHGYFDLSLCLFLHEIFLFVNPAHYYVQFCMYYIQLLVAVLAM